ncbi:heavy metal-associated domain-containing protein [Acinetobacter sp. MD2(2019)]|uniref:heavy-metal-associated domain-containing protein n=1 Tax=Acinetobacter sp. MD2(2019) TaxID=2605273 RepID=UPI002D1F0640|nr:heavy metal-associated domain-containing protein [Acinetobacter sp. MD2(2019)]MEB3753932.1 heavy-metal-associated domain-containing protein [Acinetobacter sp. MD2(2019)]
MKLEIQNMTCGGCARGVTATIKAIDPNAEINIELEQKIVTVHSQSSADEIMHALADDGFPALRKD